MADTMFDEKTRNWRRKDRIGFWIKTTTGASMIGTALWVGSTWAATRVSDIQLATAISTCAEKDWVKESLNAINRRSDSQAGVLGNVRDNLIILMERQRLRAKPLPTALKQEMLELLGDQDND